MNHPQILGMDIGGANLKFATNVGQVVIRPFAMWQNSGRLAETIRETLKAFTGLATIAVTMTGELADCFENKSEGVRHILRSLKKAIAMADLDNQVQIRVYGFSGLERVDEAIENPLDFAASNWFAIAQFGQHQFEIGQGLVIDCGSTTTDIIPIDRGRIALERFTDTQRLTDQSLVYSGVKRTPLMGLAGTVQYRGQSCLVANELFATTEDVYALLGRIEPCQTSLAADGRGKSKAECVRRIARMICADESEFDENDAIDLANQMKQNQLDQIKAAMVRQWHRVKPASDGEKGKIVVCGEGDFLVADALEQVASELGSFRLIRVADHFSDKVSTAFGAFSVARLALAAETTEAVSALQR